MQFLLRALCASLLLSIARGDGTCPDLDVVCMVSMADAATWNVTAGCALNSTTALDAPGVTVNGGGCYLSAVVGTAPYIQAGNESLKLAH